MNKEFALAECETYRDTLLGQRQDQAVEIDRLRAALAAAGDLLFDLWDGDAEMLARYEAVNNQITRALKVGACFYCKPTIAQYLDKCPNCGGPADNGHDRSHPPSPYYCKRCNETHNVDLTGSARSRSPG